jgi:hypothetical protein
MYEDESDSMFAPSANIVLPRLRAGFQVKRSMITTFFTATKLMVFNGLPQGQSFTQDYFISEILLVSAKEKLTFRRHHPEVIFPVHVDNSRCHNDRMATTEFDRRRLGRAEHPPYSPDLNPCDF